MDKLKKCPFCGSTEVKFIPGTTQGWLVECSNCDVNGPWDLGLSGATEIWNTRPLEDMLAAEIAVLRDRLNAIRATVEIINSTAWLTEANQYRIDYILEQSDLTVQPAFSGKLSPEVQKFIADAEAKNGPR